MTEPRLEEIRARVERWDAAYESLIGKQGVLPRSHAFVLADNEVTLHCIDDLHDCLSYIDELRAALEGCKQRERGFKEGLTSDATRVSSQDQSRTTATQESAAEHRTDSTTL